MKVQVKKEGMVYLPSKAMAAFDIRERDILHCSLTQTGILLAPMILRESESDHKKNQHKDRVLRKIQHLSGRAILSDEEPQGGGNALVFVLQWQKSGEEENAGGTYVGGSGAREGKRQPV